MHRKLGDITASVVEHDLPSRNAIVMMMLLGGLVLVLLVVAARRARSRES